jgi:hypothetical protein
MRTVSNSTATLYFDRRIFTQLSAEKKRGKIEGATLTPEPVFCRLALTKLRLHLNIEFIY